MVFRLLSAIGAFAHFGDAILAPFLKGNRPAAKLRAGGARIAGSLVIAVILGFVVAGTATAGNEGANNTKPTVWTIDQLAGKPDLGGKVYATITGTIGDYYVDTYKGSDYQWTDYVVGNPDSANCIIVESKKPEAEMSKLVSASGEVTLTGMLRNDSKEVGDAIRTLGSNADGLKINDTILLKEGDTPADPTTMYSIAGVCGVITLLLLVGWAIRFLVFRPAATRAGMTTSGMAAAIPVRVTGLIPGRLNGIRAREMKAELQLPTGTDPAATAGAPVGLVWATKAGVNGFPLVPGTSGVQIGTAYPFSGEKPALRLRYDSFKLVLTFDSEQSRDMAFDQLRASSGLNPGPTGASAGAV